MHCDLLLDKTLCARETAHPLRRMELQVQKEKRDLERKIDHLQAQLKQFRQPGGGEAGALADPLMGIARQRMPDRMGNMFPLAGSRPDLQEPFKAQPR